MIFKNSIRKTCGFYISEWHLVTMLLPHIVTEVENGTKIDTILNYDIKKEMKEVISRLSINDITKAKILKINWCKNQSQGINDIKEYMEKLIKNNKDIEIIVNGTKNEIDNINKNIEYWADINIDKIQETNINVINCYEVTEFNSNINHILDEHEFIINTSGEYPVGEMFESHKKKVV